MVCETSSSQSRFIAWTARRKRCPGCCIRSSGGWGSGIPLLLDHSIADGHEAQSQSLLHSAPNTAGQDEGEKSCCRSKTDQIPGTTLSECGLDGEQKDRAQDGTFERTQAADQDHEDHVRGPLHAEDRTRFDEER